MDAQTLINVLTWGLVTVGGALILSVVWFARRIVEQLDRLENLFTSRLHDLDLRVTRLEAKTGTGPRNANSGAID